MKRVEKQRSPRKEPRKPDRSVTTDSRTADNLFGRSNKLSPAFILACATLMAAVALVFALAFQGDIAARIRGGIQCQEEEVQPGVFVMMCTGERMTLIAGDNGLVYYSRDWGGENKETRWMVNIEQIFGKLILLEERIRALETMETVE